jgi:2-oxoglutarate dehydrogenase complex dehydrogenase (E1) component-like enzyme
MEQPLMYKQIDKQPVTLDQYVAQLSKEKVISQGCLRNFGDLLEQTSIKYWMPKYHKFWKMLSKPPELTSQGTQTGWKLFGKILPAKSSCHESEKLVFQ